ncbi:MAG TPA: hypothetical protein VJ939_01820 [Bacteroidales bacterium]|nr:hypothetical protein [Bacteroidales bacterium]
MRDIHNKIDQLNRDDHKEIIDFYENHKEHFDNYAQITDQDTVYDFIRIKQLYANALFHKRQYEQVMKLTRQLEDLQQKLDKSHPQFNEADRFTRFLEGLVWGSQRKFKQSLPIFKQLVEEDPENNDYRMWHNHSRFGKYKWILNATILVGVAFIWLALLTDFEEQYGVNLNLAGIVLLIAGLATWGGMNYFLFKKGKSTK